jgi:FtsP/CotA-like multicopper oxidase with cupredoxin domain
MKLNQATVAAFLSAFLATTSAASSSSTEHEEMKDKIASLLVAPKVRKMLVGFSAECNADWGALLASGYPIASYNAMTACPQAVVLSGNTATVDYSVCDPQFTESLTTACTAADGE